METTDMKGMTPPRHSDMMIKVCGNRDAANIESVAALTPMLMGFIFYRHSPRNACSLDPELIRNLPEYIRPVAVFVNDDDDTIQDICIRYGFRIVQLHGDEAPEQCRRLRDRGLVVIKAIGVDDDLDWNTLAPYSGCVDMFLFDTRTKARGGSGRKFRWQHLDAYPLDIPYILSGGIGPDDIDRIVAAMRPGMVGIDINSRFESAPGIKDVALLARFIVSLRKFNEDESIAVPFWEKR